MCGILGFNWEDKKLLKKSLDRISHRGPDASGVYSDKNISLGHRRLSIIDLSAAGKQPMSNEDGSIWIIFNGEIYNYQEAKKSLKKKHEFSSATDTEVLIHLYEEEGTDMLSKINGMFAFCIYDSKKKILFIARDCAGEKPLYYWENGEKFSFCSEIKGLIENREIKREVNLSALESYFIFRANTGEETFFKGIKKLMPGHCLVYNLKTNKKIIKQYWDWKISPEDKSEEYFIGKLRELLEDSVKRKLMSDVPYGAYLSGGIDSGAVVSLMSKHSSQPVNTFSVGFEEEKDPETDAAKFLADKIGTNHRQLLINSSAIKHLPEIIYHADEPLADPTAIPIYLLSKFTKKHSTVILTGEGADELFAGYPQYKFMKMHQYAIRHFPKIIRNNLDKPIKAMPKGLLNKGFKFASALGEKGIERFSLFAKSSKPEEQYLNQVSIFNEKEQSEILNKKVVLYDTYKHYFDGSNKQNIVGKCQYLDFKEPMVDDLLMKVDKNTMAFAIEGRVPFLDPRIIELAGKMPDSMKLKGFFKDKNILRKAVGDLVPEETRNRKKRHFFVPIDSWLKTELGPLSNELFSSKFLKNQNIFNTSTIEKINKDFGKSELFYARQKWCLLAFQIWYKLYIEDEKVKL